MASDPQSTSRSNHKFYDLPTYPNAFVGRDHHVKSIHRLLLTDDKPSLVTILGPGGIGKTRLSVRIGEVMADHFKNGVCFVPLDAVVDHEQVPLYIGHRIGLKESFKHSWTEEIFHFLRDKHLLLILDNLEQILESADFIIALVNQCPLLKILTTSRETLCLSCEIEYPLDSLNRPNPKIFPSPKDLLKFDAIDLFMQKARSVRPNFELNEENAGAIVQICQQLDGLPLPIELAAARIKLFSPEIILNKLLHSMDLLKTRSKDVVHRHQTIRNTVRWSYDLLEGVERLLFQKLSIFRGGFTPAALEAVCPNADPLDILESFINKSLIVKGPQLQLLPRFRMLKLIRDFGLEQLENNPEKDDYLKQFVHYFLSFLKQARNKSNTVESTQWGHLIEAEYENLWMALEWLMEHNTNMACDMGAMFWRYHLNRGFLREGLDMVKSLLALPMNSNTTKAELLEGAGVLSQNLGLYLEAQEYFKQCLELWNPLGKKHEIIKALNNLGWAEWRIGSYEHSISYSENALKISKGIADSRGQAKSLNNLAWVYLFQGHYQKSEDLQKQVLLIHSKAKDLKGIAFANINLAWASLLNGKLPESEKMIATAIDLFEKLKNRQLIAFSNIIKGELLYKKTKLSEAADILIKNCLPVFEEIGDVWGVAHTHQRLGRIYTQLNNSEKAAAHLTESFDLYVDSNDKNGIADCCLWFSKLNRSNKNMTAAHQQLEKCVELAIQMQSYGLLKACQLEAEKQQCDQAFRKHIQSAVHRSNKYPATKSHLPITASSLPDEDPLVEKVRLIIETHLEDPDLTISQICTKVGISHSQIHRRISTATGHSITRFIRSIRLEKAKELLADPSLTITAVAFDTGFRDPDYFHRVFKKTFGITPGAYRTSLTGQT